VSVWEVRDWRSGRKTRGGEPEVEPEVGTVVPPDSVERFLGVRGGSGCAATFGGCATLGWSTRRGGSNSACASTRRRLSALNRKSCPHH